jgi:hypothetical protein
MCSCLLVLMYQGVHLVDTICPVDIFEFLWFIGFSVCFLGFVFCYRRSIFPLFVLCNVHENSEEAPSEEEASYFL